MFLTNNLQTTQVRRVLMVVGWGGWLISWTVRQTVRRHSDETARHRVDIYYFFHCSHSTYWHCLVTGKDRIWSYWRWNLTLTVARTGNLYQCSKVGKSANEKLLRIIATSLLETDFLIPNFRLLNFIYFQKRGASQNWNHTNLNAAFLIHWTFHSNLFKREIECKSKCILQFYCYKYIPDIGQF